MALPSGFSGDAQTQGSGLQISGRQMMEPEWLLEGRGCGLLVSSIKDVA